MENGSLPFTLAIRDKDDMIASVLMEPLPRDGKIIFKMSKETFEELCELRDSSGPENCVDDLEDNTEPDRDLDEDEDNCKDIGRPSKQMPDGTKEINMLQLCNYFCDSKDEW